MKKIISLLATVAMISTLFVSVVKADFQPTVTTTKEPLSAEDFQAAFGEALAAGRDAYVITASLSDLGNLNCEIKTQLGQKKYTGRMIQGFTYEMTFDDVSAVDTLACVGNFAEADLSQGFDATDTNIFRAVYNAGSASAAYPNTNGASIAGTIADAFTFVIIVDSSKEVTASLNLAMNVVNYTNNTPGVEETCNYAAMSPSSLVFASAPVAPTPTYTDSEITIDTPVSGTTGLTDLQGREVALTKNYGIAKFSSSIDTSAKDYFLAVEAGEEKTEFAIDFGAKGVEIGGGAATFFAIVRSATRVITSIKLKEVAKSE